MIFLKLKMIEVYGFKPTTSTMFKSKVRILVQECKSNLKNPKLMQLTVFLIARQKN